MATQRLVWLVGQCGAGVADQEPTQVCGLHRKPGASAIYGSNQGSFEFSLLKQLHLCSMVSSAIAIGDCNNYLALVPILSLNVAARFSEW